MVKFDVIVGNPPYQNKSKQQIYADFYLLAKNTANLVSLIFPTGWQAPKEVNNLHKLNNTQVKRDSQIVFIDNRQNLFKVVGAEWINIILWKRNYNNQLQGKQLILTNGSAPVTTLLPIKITDTEKPKELQDLLKYVLSDLRRKGSLKDITSPRKAYGIVSLQQIPEQFISLQRNSSTDYELWIGERRKRHKVYLSSEYKLKDKTNTLERYKVFVPYAWGNMDQQTGLGGAYADIMVTPPHTACTETWLTSGSFTDQETAFKHAKYLMTRFARALLFLNKHSQHSTTSWGAIPIQDYNESWWNSHSLDEIDENLFTKYKIPQHIREFIKQNIQGKTLQNILLV
ncbi:Eco57I restriction-modification methylase domain-containing protein [Psittacicella hinzii]|uniref:Type II methyltransferase M.TaqI-like domain-containing protein n=1 Tax=Psittacicella hinzii TaxID=2028575 RepID=A0A3A1YC95_9GAMM|nr:Eco57I restriction-modification methylase domain-containing protein [Psittacicella hinzii]RIY34996.1 hypothetical protein CKF58_07285 [Psittacicella hinzii]